MNISIIPFIPRDLKLTAQGYMKMTSTSNSTKSIATRKYLIENGTRALPCDSIPHSNVSSLIFDFLLGPRKCVAVMVATTNPAATINWSTIGKKSLGRCWFSINRLKSEGEVIQNTLQERNECAEYFEIYILLRLTR